MKYIFPIIILSYCVVNVTLPENKNNDLHLKSHNLTLFIAKRLKSLENNAKGEL